MPERIQLPPAADVVHYVGAGKVSIQTTKVEEVCGTKLIGLNAAEVIIRGGRLTQLPEDNSLRAILVVPTAVISNPDGKSRTTYTTEYHIAQSGKVQIFKGEVLETALRPETLSKCYTPAERIDPNKHFGLEAQVWLEKEGENLVPVLSFIEITQLRGSERFDDSPFPSLFLWA